MLNRVVLVGRLVADPELRYTPAGHAVANFRLAVNRPFKNEQGESEADFINAVAWRKQAENLANYQKKGNLIGIDGRLQSRSYEDKDGKMVYITEVLVESIQFLESKNNNSNNNQNNAHTGNYGQSNTNTPSNQQNAYNAQNNNENSSFSGQGQEVIIDDDSLPF